MAQVFNSKERFDWDLRAFDEKSCLGAAEIFGTSKFFLRKQGDDLYLFAPDPKPLMRLITGNNDGIAIEKVHYDHYRKDSSQLKRNSGRSIFNGKVLRPIMREELLTSVAGHFNMADQKAVLSGAMPFPYWMSHLGKDTLSGDGHYEYNILLIKNSSVCAIKYHRNRAGKIHDFYNGVKILPEWPEKELKIVPILKTFSYQVPFDRNSALITNEDLLYTDALDDFLVRGVKVWAYASVEGNTELNERLQRERALNIKSALEKHLPPEVKYRIIARENWERFNEQLADSEFDSLRSFSKEEIKDLLKSKDNLQAFNHMLYDQRKAVVKVFYNTKPQDYDTVHILNHNFRQALDSIISRKSAGKTYSYYVRDAEGLYNWLYVELLKNKITEQEFMSWNFPLDATFHKLINNKFWYQYYHPEFADNMMENAIKLVGLDREASDTERFNLVSFILEKEHSGENHSGLTLEDLGRLIRSRAYRTLPAEDVLNIVIPVFGKLAVYYNHDFNTWDRKDLMLNDLLTLFDQDSTRGEQDWLKLAELSAALGNEYVAGEVIDRYSDSENTAFAELSLKVDYNHMNAYSIAEEEGNYYESLVDAFELLGESEWCGLFGDSQGISFQALDHEETYRLFRTNCTENQTP